MLERLRYRDWHALDLFDRIDVDGSQEIALSEFVDMLEKDGMPNFVVPPINLKGPGPPPGTETRRKLLTGAHSMCAFSPKLAREDSRASSCPKPMSHLMGSRCGAAIPWQSEYLGFSLRCERPNFPDMVREGLALPEDRFGTTLKSNGFHKMRGHPDRPKDLSDLSSAIASFDDSPSRDRTHS